MDVIPGVPPETLKASYSPRSVQEPSLTCTPTPPARRESVLSVRNTLHPGGAQGMVVTTVSRLSSRAMPALAYRSRTGSGRYITANPAGPFIFRSVGQPPTLALGWPESRY